MELRCVILFDESDKDITVGQMIGKLEYIINRGRHINIANNEVYGDESWNV